MAVKLPGTEGKISVEMTGPRGGRVPSGLIVEQLHSSPTRTLLGYLDSGRLTFRGRDGSALPVNTARAILVVTRSGRDGRVTK